MARSSLFSELMARLKTLAGRPVAAPEPKLSAAEQELVVNLLAGVTAQVMHEDEMEEARGKEPVSVRLVPQVPLRERAAAAGWIGGGARLPAAMPWPQIDGSPLQLLAQIDCSRLPTGLWGGLGPRNGWLAIFVDPNSVEAKVLHFAEAGPFVASPAIQEDCNIVGYDGRKRVEASGCTWTFPCWPVDFVSVFNGRNDPRSFGREQVRHQRYATRHDFVEDRRWPFDWPTARMMMAAALAAFEKAIPTSQAQHLAPPALARAEQAIIEAQKAGAAADALLGKRLSLDELRAMASVHEFACRHGAEVVARLRALKERVDAMAVSQTFSAAAIAPILSELKAMRWLHKSVPPFYRDGNKLSDAQRSSEGVQVFALPLTTHDPAANPSWVHEFEDRLLDAAKIAYLSNPATLPAALVNDCEQVWLDEALSSIGGIGNVPWGYVHEFEGDEDVTLIELPSSNLIGWQFGDVYDLVVTMKKVDLGRRDFSRVLVQVTN